MAELKIKGRSGFAVGVEKTIHETGHLVVGRTKQADVPIDDPLLSARHFEILSVRESFDLIDLESMNGTFVNGNKISRCKLINGDLIKAGKSEFEVVIADVSASQKPAEVAVTLVNAEVDLTPQSAKGSVSSDPETSVRPKTKAGFQEEFALDVLKYFDVQQLFSEAGDVSANVEPEVFVTELKQRRFLKEAIQFLAYALPKLHAVWWACLCVRHVHPELPETKKQILGLVEQWVRDPTDGRRYEIMDLASKSDMQSSADWVGISAFWSGGSIAPQGSPPVEAARDLAGKAVSGAILIASAEQRPDQVEPLRDFFIELGLEIAKGRQLWGEE